MTLSNKPFGARRVAKAKHDAAQQDFDKRRRQLANDVAAGTARIAATRKQLAENKPQTTPNPPVAKPPLKAKPKVVPRQHSQPNQPRT